MWSPHTLTGRLSGPPLPSSNCILLLFTNLNITLKGLILCSYRGWLLIILHDCIYNWAMHVHMLSLPLGAHPNCIIRACPSVVLSGFSHGKWVFGPKEQACRVSWTLRTGSGVRFYLSWSIRCENLQSFDLLANGDMVWHPAKYLCCVLT